MHNFAQSSDVRGEPVGRAHAVSPSALGALPRGVLHSREPEIELAAARCAAGSGALVWTGEPGMGKSVVLRQAAAQAEADGHVVINVAAPGDRRGEGAGLEGIVCQLVAAATLPPEIPPCLQDPISPDEADLWGPALAELVRDVAADRTTVLVADDLDVFDPLTRTALIGAVIQRRVPTVLLATAADAELVRGLPYDVERRALQPIGPYDAVSLLRETSAVPVAPHVAKRLVSALSGSPAAIVETARVLTPAQLAGASLVPDPLPVVPAVQRIAAAALADLSAADRQLLLAVAVSVVDRTDVILRALGVGIDAVISSPAAEHLDFVAGHIEIIDPRIRAAIHGAASVRERTVMHRRLAASHAEDGEEAIANWHNALATLAGDPALAVDLLQTARKLLRRGEAAWAQRVAREAMSHATGSWRGAAVGVAGIAALQAGHLIDAVELLREAVRTGDGEEQREFLGPLITAITLSGGQVPTDLSETGSMAASLAAARLHAERADIAAAYRLLDDARSRAFRVEESPTVPGRRPGDTDLTSTEAWLALMCGEVREALMVLEAGDAASESDPDRVAVVYACRALALAGCDRFDEARRTLAGAIAQLAPLRPGVAVWQRFVVNDERGELSRDDLGGSRGSHAAAVTPLAEAHLHLVSAVVETLAGQLDRAAADLLAAALRLPIALPLAGLAAVLAGRLDLLVRGKTGAISQNLVDLVPLPPANPVRVGMLVNRALAASLAGDHAEAATLLDLSHERPDVTLTHVLALPGPDATEEWHLANRPVAAAAALQRLHTDQGEARNAAAVAERARLAVLTASDGDVDARVADALALGRNVHSPLERGRTHLLVGRVLLARQARQQAVDQLRTAVELFEESGAVVLADVARAAVAVPEAVSPPGAEPAAGRILAEDIDLPATLTDRERDVVRLVAAGASNRDVAAALYVSVRTVEVHLTRVFRKLGVGSRVELAVLVQRGHVREIPYV